jgi:multiple sugar transport system substrate-binding protein
MTSNHRDRTLAARDPFTFTRRQLVGGASAAVAAGMIGRQAAVEAQDAELVFAYWGSPQEQEAVKVMTEDFNEQHPDINVRPQYIPNDGYREKVTTMLAGGTPPDIAYMDAGLAFAWAVEGQTLDIRPYVDADPESPTLLPNTNYYYDDGKIMSTSLATGIMLTFYNKKLFDEAGIPVPPSKAADAWQWDEFVEIAKKLTKDSNGNDATSPDFDPERIDTYGVSFQQWWGGWIPLIWSNGGDVASEDGMTLMLNQPEAVEALQKMQDLIYVHHVAPTPAQSESLPATDILLRTGKLAMDLNGMWKVLDYSQTEGLDWSVGVLPYFKEITTIRWGIPIIISAACKYPDQAYEFYRWRYSPERIDLYAKGLWMPIQTTYYTEEDKIAAWIDAIEGVYPPESRDVFIDYALNNPGKFPPQYWLKNLDQIMEEAVTPAMESIFAGEATAQEAMDTAVEAATPMMQGRWAAAQS